MERARDSPPEGVLVAAVRLLDNLAGRLGYERRNDSYTDLAVSAVEAQASGSAPLKTGQLAAVETCAGLWGRTLAAATVEPAQVRAALPPPLLAMAGRSLFLWGNFYGRIAVGPSGLIVRPCTAADVRGLSPDPLVWNYLLDVPAPDGASVERVPAPDVLHLRHTPAPSAPWRGVSPLQGAGLDARLLSSLTFRAGQEAQHPTGTLTAMGDSGRRTPSAGQGEELAQTAAGMAGHTRLIGGAGSLPSARVGFQPPAEARNWANDQERRIMGAAGIAPPLFLAMGDGTAAREAFRRYSATTAAYLGAIIEAEAAAKFETPVQVTFERLRGSDTQGLGRAVKALVDAGADYGEALVQVGLA